jgi:hypothetical protein
MRVSVLAACLLIPTASGDKCSVSWNYDLIYHSTLSAKIEKGYHSYHGIKAIKKLDDDEELQTF